LVILSVKHMDHESRQAIYEAFVNFHYGKRLTDYWGWYSEDKLGLILTETNEIGAKTVVMRLKDHLCGIPKLQSQERALRNGRFAVTEYPKILQENIIWEMSKKTDQLSEGETISPCVEETGCLIDPKFLEKTCLNDQSPKRLGAKLDSLFRRVLDLGATILVLIPIIPVMAIVGLLIKCTSRGPVLFKQQRIGQFGKKFTFLKFRTMYHNCDQTVHEKYVSNFIEDKAEKHEKNGREYFKLVDDPRITTVGKFLRETSLDELPQLFNVFKGEMSLVGPRPPIDYEVKKYQTWQLRRILEAKPGITGLWQVLGRSSTRFDDQVRLDLKYVEKQSFWLNIWILFKTIGVVFTRKGGS